MSEWMNKLDLIDLWKKRDDKKITIVKLGKEIAKRIRHLKCYINQKDILEEIAVGFEMIEEDVNEFDYILNDLYDWADTALDNEFGGKKMCWIASR